MEELRNETVEMVEVEEVGVDNSYDNNEEVVDVKPLDSEKSNSGLITIGVGLGLAAVSGAIYLRRKMKAKKRAKIEAEAMAKCEEILRQAGQSDEEIEAFINKMYNNNDVVETQEESNVETNTQATK